jgi:hypothetical protein
MSKAVIKIVRVLLVGHLLPVTLFTLTIFMASAVVTACSPSRGSTLKDSSPAEAQTSLKTVPPAAAAVTSPQSDLQKNLSGTWECATPKDAADPCFGQNLIFNASLDKMSENTFISLNDSDENSGDKCHVEIDYSLSVDTDKNGDVTLNLGTATLGSLIKDPSNADECGTDFQDSKIPNLNRHQLLSHTDDWKQITLDGTTYTRPDPSKASQAETWPSP